MTYQLHCGDCINIMPMIERESVDAIVTDPPYGLGFMGKDWDHGVPGMHFWLEALRCAKPGAHLLAFGGTRTFHRLAVAIEDAGWEIRDTVMWVYGQGFPKSHDVSKAIDKEAGAEREVVTTARRSQVVSAGWDRPWKHAAMQESGGTVAEYNITSPATPLAVEWSGWGTALKPAWEPIIVARKPLVGTVAENVQRYGTGAINVDACRVSMSQDDADFIRKTARPNSAGQEHIGAVMNRPPNPTVNVNESGRWPANLIHDGSAEVLAGFPMTGISRGGNSGVRGNAVYGQFGESKQGIDPGFNDTGSAARFFYCAKASKQDRDEGCEEFNETSTQEYGTIRTNRGAGYDEASKSRNHHPTVKPTSLMRYLCKLVTPPNGVILDPFMGSGSTGKAAILEGFNFIGVELEQEYLEIAARRIEHACGKVGIVVDQPMLIESRRQVADRPKQLILL